MANILTPVGRMVQGDPFKVNTTDKESRPLVDKSSNPRVNYFYAIAIPKNDPGYPAILQTIQAEGVKGFPGGETQLSTFAWKIADGDAPENVQKEGFAGHWVLRCSGGFAPKVYTANGAEQIIAADPARLKRGDYIRTYLNVAPNGSTTKPGVYLNPVMVEVVGYGTEIVSGPDAAAVFGAAPAGALPPGASATPVGGPAIAAPVGMPGAAPVGMPGAAPAPVPQQAAAILQQAAAPGGMPRAAPVPQVAIPQQAAATAIPAPPQPQAQAPVVVMTAKAGGATYEQMLGAGWTDEALIEQGYMMNTAPGATPAPGFLNAQ